MATEAGQTGNEATDDLWQRLRASRAQERAFRAEARLLARELALTHRLLRFLRGEGPPPRPRPAAVTAPAAPPVEVPRLRATPLTQTVMYHLDSWENRGAYTAIYGWAFRPATGWDARATTVTLRFRHGAAVFQVATTRMPRADVAAHFAAQGAGSAGGATGLDGVGFGCEVLHDSLPANSELEIVLRLDCAGMACEQATGTFLRL